MSLADLLLLLKVLADERRLPILLYLIRARRPVHYKVLENDFGDLPIREIRLNLGRMRSANVILNDGDGHLSVNWVLLNELLSFLSATCGYTPDELLATLRQAV